MTPAAHRLVVENVEWARKYAQAIGRRMPTRHRGDDLEGAALLGLVEAASAYRPCAVPFRAFAYRRLKGAIIDFARENHMVKPSMEDRRAFRGAFPVHPIEKHAPVLMSKAPSPEDEVIAADILARVGRAATKRQRQILFARWQGARSSDVANEVGVTQSRICQELHEVKMLAVEILA